MRNTIPVPDLGVGPAATEEPKFPFAVRKLPGKPREYRLEKRHLPTPTAQETSKKRPAGHSLHPQASRKEMGICYLHFPVGWWVICSARVTCSLGVDTEDPDA